MVSLLAAGLVRLAPTEPAPTLLVAPETESPQTLRIGLTRYTLRHPRTVAPGAVLDLPEGTTIRLVDAAGRSEVRRGPSTATAPDGPAFPPVPAASGAAPEFRLLSPQGLTRWTTPDLAWRDPFPVGTPRADVALIDTEEERLPPLVAVDATSPVPFAALESPRKRPLVRDRIYEVLIRRKLDGAVEARRVLVRADAEPLPAAFTPGEALAEAVNALREKPYRLGDAHLALARLPAAWAQTPAVAALRGRLEALAADAR